MTRVLSAGVLLAVVIGTLWLAPVWATVGLAALAAALAGGELAGLARATGAAVPPVFLGAGAALVCIAFAVGPLVAPGGGKDAFEFVLLAGLIATGAVSLAGPPGPAAFVRAGVAMMGPLYVGLPLGALASIRAFSGPAAVLWLIIVVTVSDSAQYYTGRLAGRHKLAPVVSPGKTVEGAIGGVIAATIAGAVAGPRLVEAAPLTMATGALVGALVAAFGILGDLFESLLKRSAGAKDSSSLIPGHGGVLDRLDSYLFAAPCFYVVLRVLG